MATIVVTLKIMPESPETDLKAIEHAAAVKIKAFAGEVARTEHVPVAFGLKSVNIMFTMDENIGSTESLEKEIATLPHVASVDVIDVRRTVG